MEFFFGVTASDVNLTINGIAFNELTLDGTTSLFYFANVKGIFSISAVTLNNSTLGTFINYTQNILEKSEFTCSNILLDKVNAAQVAGYIFPIPFFRTLCSIIPRGDNFSTALQITIFIYQIRSVPNAGNISVSNITIIRVNAVLGILSLNANTCFVFFAF